MGFTGLARWVNAPSQGIQLVRSNLMLNHGAVYQGKWNLSVKSYRSVLNTDAEVPVERSMYTLTMDENVFILVEDFQAPTKADVLAVAPPGQEEIYLQNPPHFRNTFLTVSPPGALEQLLSQIKAKWVPVRQQTSSAQNRQTSGQLTVEGHIYQIGSDWIIRFGNVVLPGSTIKGMLLEAEYLPLPVLHSPMQDGTSELLSNLLTSILPYIKDAKTVAVTISDSQWEDVLWDRENMEKQKAKKESEKVEDQDENDPYLWDAPETKEWKEGDWVGIDRDQRSAFLIMGALRSEGLL